MDVQQFVSLVGIVLSSVNAVVLPPRIAHPAPVTWSSRIGGNHGAHPWNDGNFNENGPLRLRMIELFCGERLDGMRFTFAQRSDGSGHSKFEFDRAYGWTEGLPTALLHLNLADDGLQYVTTVSTKTVQVKHSVVWNERTRIGWIEFGTNDGQHISCGKAGHDKDVVTWDYPGKALSFTTGTFGKEIDSITGAFIDITQY